MADTGGQFTIHPGDVQAVAPTFSQQSASLQTALESLKQSLTGLGAPWGDDKQGKEFGDAYSPPHDSVIASIGVLVQGLESIHDGLAAHADNHTRADQYSAQQLPKQSARLAE
ncbi:WXG100 family type VII secretion target [Kitasatospora azatica]|uniref:WXG100 family type VII secretion target n=1 Tax=Kitasatospora azatica TaxID=58347 RepID=UPI0007C79BB3|nr:hypothetical protein [Kitasatospora azatica]